MFVKEHLIVRDFNFSGGVLLSFRRKIVLLRSVFNRVLNSLNRPRLNILCVRNLSIHHWQGFFFLDVLASICTWAEQKLEYKNTFAHLNLQITYQSMNFHMISRICSRLTVKTHEAVDQPNPWTNFSQVTQNMLPKQHGYVKKTYLDIECSKKGAPLSST